MSTLLEIKNLTLGFCADPAQAVVRGIDLTLERGRTLGIVGESGSGKSLTALALMRLLPPGARLLSGTMNLDGTDLAALNDNAMRRVRGARVAMLFQDPLSSFNPLHRIGRQIGEALITHKGWDARRTKARVAGLLRQVGMDEPDRFMRAFPHQLSGGQRQRAMLAMALANEPDLLIADEPTTALDAAVQQQIVDLLASLKGELSIIVISHDLAMTRQLADDVCVMRAGEIVERGTAQRVFATPSHPYTRMLLDRGGELPPSPVPDSAPPVLKVAGLEVRYPAGSDWLGRTRSWVHAVREASFTVRRGECLGIVGESGSGKSSLGLAVTRLIASRGSIDFCGTRLDLAREKELRPLRRRLQIVFQDPLAALNPRLTVRDCIAEGLEQQGENKAGIEERVIQAMEEVDLDPAMRHRYPHEFSGGQCQRICLARALVMQPQCIVFDEPTSSLDRNTQFQVVELLRRLQHRHGLAGLFITHDLTLVRRLCHRVLIMQGGQVLEQGATERVFDAPEHPYTRRLLAAALDLAPSEQTGQALQGATL